MSNPEPSTWTIHLAKKRPGKAVVAIIIIILALFAVQTVWQNWILIALAALLLIGSLAEFFFPVTYTLDERGASSRHFGSYRILPWSQVRRVYLFRHGIKLSPLGARSWAETYRGVMLRMTDREAVLAHIQAWLDAAGVTPSIIED